MVFTGCIRDARGATRLQGATVRYQSHVMFAFAELDGAFRQRKGNVRFNLYNPVEEKV